MTGQWFSPGTSVSSTNKTDRHDITEISLKVALKTVNQTSLHRNETDLCHIKTVIHRFRFNIN